MFDVVTKHVIDLKLNVIHTQLSHEMLPRAHGLLGRSYTYREAAGAIKALPPNNLLLRYFHSIYTCLE